MSTSFTAAHFNELLDLLGTTDGKTKVASKMTAFIRDREKSDSLFAKIWPEQKVSEKDPEIQRSTEHDTLAYMVESGPEARAMSASFRGEPQVRYYTSPRFLTPFYKLQTERLQQSELDMMAYRYDMEKMVRERALDAMMEVYDRRQVVLCEGATIINQKEEQGIAYSTALTVNTAFTAFNVAAGVPEIGKVKGTDALTAGAGAAGAAAGVVDDQLFPLQKDDITKLLKLFPGTGGPRKSHLKCKVIGISATDILDMNNWSTSEVGDEIAKETTVKGYKYSTVQGIKYATTTNTGVLRPGNIFAFADRSFVGGCATLRPLKSYVDKELDRFTFEANKIIATYIGNIAGVRKLELYAGSAETVAGGANTAMQARFAPLAESEFGALNNLISKGGTVGTVTDF
jgi:hypothetical protein